MQPLSGIKVLDFTTLLPGPLAGLVLSEAGAEVTKVERPEGEEIRKYLPRWGAESIQFNLLNSGKKSITADLKSDADRDRIKSLIAGTDILIEQFRPGVMARFGLGYDAVKQIRPDIVYCSITGYGQFGPKAAIAGHDLNYISETGLLSLSFGNADRTVVPPALIADIGGGTMPAVINILLALLRRNASGEGAYIDIAMSDAMFTYAWWAFGLGKALGEWPGNGDHMLSGGSPRYQIFPTRDGRFVAVAALEQKFWDNLCELVGLEERLRDDQADPAATIGALRAIIGNRTAEEWRAVFEGKDCAANVVRTLEEASTDPHFIERGLFDYSIENDAGARAPALVVPVAPQFRSDKSTPRRAPGLGTGNGPDPAASGSSQER
ncbi:CaiB/BaiF CoA-transferase family protein [Microbaculum marinum]|uniref:CaiB/BaiF CoA-transferase family protein n=1 Tax=Microbaculum marinum TaxID=1764581 RepID=A0AAW9RMU7_9HYPH